VIILDEPTTALDADSKDHRGPPAPQIVQLDRGRIVQTEIEVG
jgi:ABC-type transport system involved in cytochrome bd biosynthesis fused ATPase/permease subunit